MRAIIFDNGTKEPFCKVRVILINFCEGPKFTNESEGSMTTDQSQVLKESIVKC